jgi:hypothetical protein
MWKALASFAGAAFSVRLVIASFVVPRLEILSLGAFVFSDRGLRLGLTVGGIAGGVHSAGALQS